MKYPCFQLHFDLDLRWHWCLVGANGVPCAWSRDRYESAHACIISAYSLPDSGRLPYYYCVEPGPRRPATCEDAATA
jgi:hypothetical protein